MSDFIQNLLNKELISVAITGSVDDGKSTFIGRLLYDTQATKDDIIQNVSYMSKTYSGVPLDFALFVDGLKKEVEQGITIDLAFRYIYTPKKKIILIDTPGHPQYTQNAFSGLSIADALIFITDISRGLTTQSTKLLSCAYLLGIKNILIAINKIDKVNYEWQAIKNFEQKITELLGKIKDIYQHVGIFNSPKEITILPISAKNGDNIVRITYDPEKKNYKSVFDWMNNLKSEFQISSNGVIGIVNAITRDSQKRYIGVHLLSGKIYRGQVITILPQGVKSAIDEIYVGEEEQSEVFAPRECTIVLTSDVDITYEQIITTNEEILNNASEIDAVLLWTSKRKSSPEKKYLLRNHVGTYPCFIVHPVTAVDVEKLAIYESLEMNENTIYSAKVVLPSDFYYLPYSRNKNLGTFILIEEFWQEIVGAGIIL